MRPTDRYVWSRLDDLTAAQVHDVLQLRQQAFIVEQECVFADIDGLDRVAWHLLAFDGGELAACLRVLPPGVGGEEVAIGRIAVRVSRRREGLGRHLVQRGVEAAQQQFGVCPIRLAAQVRLVDFYTSLGFRAVGPPFDEDGIRHVPMRRPRIGRARVDLWSPVAESALRETPTGTR